MPELRFGVVQGDPAEAMFTPANFPGASTADDHQRAARSTPS